MVLHSSFGPDMALSGWYSKFRSEKVRRGGRDPQKRAEALQLPRRSIKLSAFQGHHRIHLSGLVKVR